MESLWFSLTPIDFAAATYNYPNKSTHDDVMHLAVVYVAIPNYGDADETTKQRNNTNAPSPVIDSAAADGSLDTNAESTAANKQPRETIASVMVCPS